MNNFEKNLIDENFFINGKMNSFSSREFIGSKTYWEINENIFRKSNDKSKNDFFSFIESIGQRFNCKYFITLGCSQLDLLRSLSQKFEIIGLDYKHIIEQCRSGNIPGQWIEYNLEKDQILPINNQILKEAIIICINKIEHLENPYNLFFTIKTAMEYSPLCIITTPERELQQSQIVHSSKLLSCKRKWRIAEFNKLLDEFKFNKEFVGLTKINKSTYTKDHILSIIGNEKLTKIFEEHFKVVAIMAVYNEEDIIYDSISKLIDQQIFVYVLDNWSSDKTFRLLKNFKNNPFFIGCERFPRKKQMNDNQFNLEQVLDRKAELASQIEADWFIHCDADEIRVSPWQELNLKEAIQYVDKMGYNAIDHTVINFHPINNDFSYGDFEEHFKHFEITSYPGFVKTWKKNRQRINLSRWGGHQAQFEDRKVAPFNFLVKHYPLRSQSHAEKKIFYERKPRYMKQLKDKGWHIQYDEFRLGNSFLRNQDELFFFSSNNFSSYFLVERLSNLV